MRMLVLMMAGCLCLSPWGSGLDAQARKPAPRPTLTALVTNLEGTPLPDVAVSADGPVDREGSTDAQGTITFRNMNAGQYRLRFLHDEYVTLEKDVTVQAGRPLKVAVSLNAAPAPLEPPSAPPAPKPNTPTTTPSGPPAEPTTVSLPDFIERNYVGRNPALVLRLGCAAAATATLLQLREPLAEHRHDDADETLYVVAGDGNHRVNGRDTPISAGTFALVPRGTTHAISRRGSNPIIVLSVLSGPPCTNGQ